MSKKLLVIVLVCGLSGIVSAGLVHEWEFEGNTNDTSGSGNHGTKYGGAAQYVTGVDGGQALSFDGADDEVLNLNCNNLPTEVEESNWSMNQYIYMDSAPGSFWNVGAGFGQDATQQARYLHHYNIRFYGYASDFDTGVPWDIGAWQMVTVTWEGVTVHNPTAVTGNMKIYKNNELIGEKSVLLADSVQHARAGNLGYYHYFDGVLDGFQIYDHVLSDAERTNLYSRIPEPATIALLSLGGLALIRRKSR